jgi:hypothetical protein
MVNTQAESVKRSRWSDTAIVFAGDFVQELEQLAENAADAAAAAAAVARAVLRFAGRGGAGTATSEPISLVELLSQTQAALSNCSDADDDEHTTSRALAPLAGLLFCENAAPLHRHLLAWAAKREQQESGLSAGFWRACAQRASAAARLACGENASAPSTATAAAALLPMAQALVSLGASAPARQAVLLPHAALLLEATAAAIGAVVGEQQQREQGGGASVGEEDDGPATAGSPSSSPSSAAALATVRDVLALMYTLAPAAATSQDSQSTGASRALGRAAGVLLSALERGALPPEHRSPAAVVVWACARAASASATTVEDATAGVSRAMLLALLLLPATDADDAALAPIDGALANATTTTATPLSARLASLPAPVRAAGLRGLLPVAPVEVLCGILEEEGESTPSLLLPRAALPALLAAVEGASDGSARCSAVMALHAALRCLRECWEAVRFRRQRRRGQEEQGEEEDQGEDAAEAPAPPLPPPAPPFLAPALREALLRALWARVDEPQSQVARVVAEALQELLAVAAVEDDEQQQQQQQQPPQQQRERPFVRRCAALALSAAPGRRGRYIVLGALLPLLPGGAREMLRLEPCLLEQALGATPLTAPAGVAAALVRALADPSLGQQQQQQPDAATTTINNNTTALSPDEWAPAVRSALTSGGEALRGAVATRVLPLLLPEHPSALPRLLLPADGADATDKEEATAAVVAVLKAARRLRLVPDLDAALRQCSSAASSSCSRVGGGGSSPDEGAESPPPLLLAAVAASAEALRCDALELACVNPRGTDLPSPTELAVAEAWVRLSLARCSTAARGRCRGLLRKLFARQRTAVAAALRAGGGGGGKSDNATAAIALRAQAEFLQRVTRALIGGLYPGAPFGRKYLSAELLGDLLETWRGWPAPSSPAPAADPASSSSSLALAASAFSPLIPELLDRATTANLLASALDSWERLRLAAARCLALLPAPLPGLAAPAEAARAARGWGWAALSSPRLRDSDAGALVLQSLLLRYGVGLGWDLRLAHADEDEDDGEGAANGDGGVASGPSAPFLPPGAVHAAAAFLEALLARLRFELDLASSGPEGFEQACRAGLAHGALIATRYACDALPWRRLLAAASAEERARLRLWLRGLVEALERAGQLCAPLLEMLDENVAAGEVVGAEGGEGEEGPGAADEASAAPQLGPRAQVQVTACWMTTKEVGLLAGTLAARLPLPAEPLVAGADAPVLMSGVVAAAAAASSATAAAGAGGPDDADGAAARRALSAKSAVGARGAGPKRRAAQAAAAPRAVTVVSSSSAAASAVAASPAAASADGGSNTATTTTTAPPSPLLMSPRDVDRLGSLVLSLLLRVKHNGAFDALHQGLRAMAARLLLMPSSVAAGAAAAAAALAAADGGDASSPTPPLPELPERWMRAALSHLRRPGQCRDDILRRSAGVPYAVLALALAEPAGGGARLLASAARELLLVASPPAPSPSGAAAEPEQHEPDAPDQDEGVPWPRVHALNALTLVLGTGALVAQTRQFVSPAFEAAVQGHAARWWEVRNAAAQATAALTVRLVGARNPASLVEQADARGAAARAAAARAVVSASVEGGGEPSAASSSSAVAAAAAAAAAACAGSSLPKVPTAAEFFVRYPALHGFFLARLRRAADELACDARAHQSAAAGWRQQRGRGPGDDDADNASGPPPPPPRVVPPPGLVPILALLSRLRPALGRDGALVAPTDPLSPAALAAPVAACGRNAQQWSVREMAASALPALVPVERLAVACAALGPLPAENAKEETEQEWVIPSHNAVHGALLQMEGLLAVARLGLGLGNGGGGGGEGKDGDDEALAAARSALPRLAACAWLADPQKCSCAPVRVAYLQAARQAVALGHEARLLEGDNNNGPALSSVAALASALEGACRAAAGSDLPETDFVDPGDSAWRRACASAWVGPTLVSLRAWEQQRQQSPLRLLAARLDGEGSALRAPAFVRAAALNAAACSLAQLAAVCLSEDGGVGGDDDADAIGEIAAVAARSAAESDGSDGNGGADADASGVKARAAALRLLRLSLRLLLLAPRRGRGAALLLTSDLRQDLLRLDGCPDVESRALALECVGLAAAGGGFGGAGFPALAALIARCSDDAQPAVLRTAAARALRDSGALKPLARAVRQQSKRGDDEATAASARCWAAALPLLQDEDGEVRSAACAAVHAALLEACSSSSSSFPVQAELQLARAVDLLADAAFGGEGDEDNDDARGLALRALLAAVFDPSTVAEQAIGFAPTAAESNAPALRRLFEREADNQAREPLLCAQLAARALRRRRCGGDGAATASAILRAWRREAEAYVSRAVDSGLEERLACDPDAYLALAGALLAVWCGGGCGGGDDDAASTSATELSSVAIAAATPFAQPVLLRPLMLAVARDLRNDGGDGDGALFLLEGGSICGGI